MNGSVDADGRALISVEVQSGAGKTTVVEAWIDTGFTGELVLPQKMIEDLGLPFIGSGKAILADGSQISLKSYTCNVIWFGESRRLQIIANDGDCPLLGVGLLLGHDLLISYRNNTITLT